MNKVIQKVKNIIIETYRNIISNVELRCLAVALMQLEEKLSFGENPIMVTSPEHFLVTFAGCLALEDIKDEINTNEKLHLYTYSVRTHRTILKTFETITPTEAYETVKQLLQKYEQYLPALFPITVILLKVKKDNKTIPLMVLSKKVSPSEVMVLLSQILTYDTLIETVFVPNEAITKKYTEYVAGDRYEPERFI